MSTIKLGYARKDITPTESVPLRGYGNTSVRMHTNVLDPLYATCLAFTDAEGETALLFAMDLCSLIPAYAEQIRDDLCGAVGLAPERVLCSCTHNHSSPDLANKEQDSVPRYIAYLKAQMIAAAREALADQKPAKAQIGRIHTNMLNHVRRYVMADGTYAGDNYGRFKDNVIAGHESNACREGLLRCDHNVGRLREYIIAGVLTNLCACVNVFNHQCEMTDRAQTQLLFGVGEDLHHAAVSDVQHNAAVGLCAPAAHDFHADATAGDVGDRFCGRESRRHDGL